MLNVGKTLLRPIARVAGFHAWTQLQKYKKSLRKTAEIQSQLLKELLENFSHSDFSRENGLAFVKNYHDFKNALPIQDYESLKPYINRTLNGDYNAMFSPGEKLLMFSMTSGSTGEPKYIPVTQRFLEGIRFGWNAFGMNMYIQNSNAWLRHIVQLSSAMREETSAGGLPCGAISGLLAATQKKIVRHMYPAPEWVSSIENVDCRYYAVLRHSVAVDVAFITTANPSSTIKLIETGTKFSEVLLRDIHDGTITLPCDVNLRGHKLKKFKPRPKLAARIESSIARDGEFMPGHVWNLSLIANWTGGTLRLYMQRLRELFGNIPIYDIGLLASEGRFSIPLAPNTPAGPAEICNNFLEFIPATQRSDEHPDTLLAHELEIGREYFLVFTNWTGFMRYNLDDRVIVRDFIGTCPVIEFLSRGLRTSSITGEKITEHQVVEAMRLASAELDMDVELFELQGRFLRNNLPRYELRMELDDMAAGTQLAELMDKKLAALNIEYNSKRKSGRLDSIVPLILPKGTMEKAEFNNIKNRHGRAEQYKHQYLITDIMED
ncbi:MAG TPA: GH3 auxin-responsive promoter family protein [Phycisphaerae bacterium]|nr:GH3 auxin-responsive promoter family protein [Phycisphaerae bacterium]